MQNKKKDFRVWSEILFDFWCRRRESNSHGLSPTTPSRWRVYQFHHFGVGVEFLTFS
jgi:hypothetical protein